MYIGQRIDIRFKKLVLVETSNSDSVLYGLEVSKVIREILMYTIVQEILESDN